MAAGMKRVLFWSIAVTCVVAAIAWSFRPQPVPVDLASATVRPMVVTVDEEGKTRVRDVFVVSAPVMGRARRTQLDVGDVVQKDVTVVGEIEPTAPAFLDERARAEAESDVASAEDALILAKAEVDQAVAELDFAKIELERARSLATSGTISIQSIDDAHRVFRTRSAALATAQASVQVHEHALSRTRSRLTSPVGSTDRTGTCECVVLKSPVSGRVLEIHHQSEAVVLPAQPLVSLGDPRMLEIAAEMLSTDAVRVRAGNRVLIEGWGGEDALVGAVERVEPFGFTKVSALGIEEQRVNVIIGLRGDPSSWTALGHGFRVDVRVVVWETDATLTVPLTALFRSGDGWSLFTEDAGRAGLRRVSIGQRAGLTVQITEGLRAGEHVVVSPSDRVRDGVLLAQRGR